MVSESPTTERRAALRALLVERAAEQSAPDRRPSGRPAAEPGRLRTLLVTGVVAAAVVAGTLVALQLTGPDAPTVAPAATPTAAATEAAPAPTPTPTESLITPVGSRRLTREQLHAFVAGSSTLQQDPANAAIWEEQAWLDIRCMAAHGWVYDPIAVQGGPTAGGDGLTTAQRQEFEVLMDGPPTDAPYDWRTAGCHGLSVHETGQDHAN